MEGNVGGAVVGVRVCAHLDQARHNVVVALTGGPVELHVVVDAGKVGWKQSETSYRQLTGVLPRQLGFVVARKSGGRVKVEDMWRPRG